METKPTTPHKEDCACEECVQRDVATIIGANQIMRTALTAVQNFIDGVDAITQDDIDKLRDKVTAALAGAPLTTLDLIHAEMDGKEWDSDTTEAVAGHLRDAGYTVRDLIDEEDLQE